jgi:NAD(P)H-nitrite reductase large subunit
MEQSKTVICRCEEVTLAELLKTAKSYPSSTRELKLRTRAGMGYCGGRTCRPLLDAIMQHAAGQEPVHSAALVYQPPVRPVSFHLLGGKQ